MSQATTKPLDQPQDYNPEEYRMTIGEHLEELRRRFTVGLVGFVIVATFMFIYGKEVLSYFCQPLVQSLLDAKMNPQIYMTAAGDGFMVFMQINLICATAVSGPWLLYQVWLFIAAGLYPHERKYVTKYVPVSMALLVMGMAFVYFFVLPWTLAFFLGFASDIPLHPHGLKESPKVVTTQPMPKIPILDGDPTSAENGSMWYDASQQRFKVMIKGESRVLPFSPTNLIAPQITLPEYIDLVVGMLIVFGLAFQLPLVVLALLKIGIVELEGAKAARKIVYFAMSIIAAVITPGDVITATIALMVPLCLLYELGIFLYVMGERGKPKVAA